MNQFSKRNSHIFSFQDCHIFLRWILTSLTSGVGDEGPVLRKRGMAGLRASPGPSPAAHRPGARGVTSNSRIKGVALVTFALPPGSAALRLGFSPSPVSPLLCASLSHLHLHRRQSPLTGRAQLSSALLLVGACPV